MDDSKIGRVETSAYLLKQYRAAFPESEGFPRAPPNTYAGLLFTQWILNWIGLKFEAGTEEDPQVLSDIHEVHWSICWAADGFPTFQLSHSLVTALLLTDPGNVRADEIVWPLDLFRIVLPQPNCPISFWDPDSDAPIPVTSIGVRRTITPSTVEDKRRVGEYVSTNSGWFRRGRMTRQFSFPPLEKEGAGTEWAIRFMAVGGKDRQLWQSSPWPPTGAGARVRDWASETAKHDDGFTQLDGDATKAIRRLIVNLLLYLQVLKQNGREVTKKVRHKGTVDHYEVPLVTPESGRTIRLDPELHAAARDWATSGRQPARWKLSSQVVVMGHYRDVPYGPMNVDPRPTRQRWIEPYRRGPEDKDPVAHTYKVGK